MNKNKKGFTLVELIAVIAFIAIVVLIATPNIINQIRKNKEVRYKNFVGDLCLASEAYMNKNDLIEDLQEENDTVTINISDLISEGYIKSTLINPKTNSTITNDLLEVKLDSDKNYDCTLLSGKVKVTFNPNGGTVSKRTKSVTVGQTYGTLPTPTREGYTFKGWNGKNLLNKETSSIFGIRNETEVSEWATSAFNYNWILTYIEPSTTYTISYDVECTKVPEYDTKYSPGYGFFGLYTSERESTGSPYLLQLGTASYLNAGDKKHINETFSTPSDLHSTYAKYKILVYTNRYLNNNVAVLGSIVFSNIQLEEGSTATEYEPYYITSSTKVVQSSDHTLKAIWEENET